MSSPLGLTIKTNLSSMEIGDCIPCRYTTTTSGMVGYFSELGTCVASEIPLVGTATPNGLFYWIYVGKDYLGRRKFISDRNIQHTISWDSLNTNGIVSEVNKNTDFCYKDIANTSTITASSSFNGTYIPSKVVDGLYPNGSELNGWASNTDSSTEWLKMYINDNIKTGIIKLYNSIDSDLNLGVYTSSIDVMASEDDVTYTLLTKLSFTGSRQWGTVTVPDNTNYKYFKFTNHTSVYPSSVGTLRIGEIQLLKKLDVTHNYNIRLLTGGTSTTDTNNEWDEIIVGSTLNNIITAGDTNVWNWSGISSWTSTSGTTSTNKIIRGNSNVGNTNAPTGIVSSISNTNTGFRPLLLVESLLKKQYLIKQNDNYYTIKSDNYDSTTTHNFTPLTLTGGITPNKSDIETFCFTDLNLLTNNMIKDADTFIPISKFDNTAELKMYKEE